MKQIKKQSKKTEIQPASSYFFLPLSLFVLLLIGTVVSIVQLQHNQASQSRATIGDTPPSVVTQDCTVTSEQLVIKSQEQSFFDQINAYRQQHGIATLHWSATLKQAAAWMSNDMLVHTSLNHTDSVGRNTLARLEQCGYSDSTDVGENIENGTADYSIILPSWESAPAQNTNLLDPQFTQAAIALATGTNGQYWVVDFGGTSPTLFPTATTIPGTPTNPPVTQSITKTPTSIPTNSVTKVPTPTQGGTVTPQLTLIPTIKPTITPNPTSIVTPTVAPPLPTFATTPKPSVTPIPTPVPFVANPDDTQVFVLVKMAGLGKDGNAKPKHLSRHVRVDIFDQKNKLALSGNGFLTFDGNLFSGTIHLGKLANDTYYIKVVGDNTLEELILPQFQILSNDKLNMLPQITLLQGDLNVDNIIDLNDFTLLLQCFQDVKCQNKTAIDFTDNGTVDIVDYNLFLQNFLHHTGD